VQLFPDAGAWEAFQKDTSMPVPRAFDIELLPYIAEEATDHLEVPYRTSACGTQNILIVARAGVSDEVVTAKASISNDPCIAYFPILPVGTAD
jgi:hypothetical protein